MFNLPSLPCPAVLLSLSIPKATCWLCAAYSVSWNYRIPHTLNGSSFQSRWLCLFNHDHGEEETLVPSSYRIGCLIKWTFIISFTHPSPSSLPACMCVCSRIIFLMKSSGNEANHIRWMDRLTNRIKPVNWMHIVMANCYSIIKSRSWRGRRCSRATQEALTWEQTGMTNKRETKLQGHYTVLSLSSAPNNHF